jgi:hypothetical protein
MNYSYENQGTNTYLVYTMDENETVDTMSLGMLTNNKIHGLAPALYTQMDATRYIKYNISAKISVQQYFTGQINKRRLIGVFSGIANAIIAAEDYMIDMNSMVFDLNYIFVDVSTNETELICLPIVEQSLQSFDVGTFFKNIVFSSQFDPTENCDYVTKIINFLNSSPAFSVYEFKKMLDELTEQQSVQQPQPVVQQPQSVAQQPQPVAQQPQPVAQQPATQKPVSQQSATAPQPKSNNVAIPNAPVQQKPAVPQAQAKQETSEKKISMFGLLTHYNKENAAAYKAQKESKKKTSSAPAPAKQPAKAPAPNAGFAIPGQPVAPHAPKADFAVPGQPTPPPAPPRKETPKAQTTEKPQNKQPAVAPTVKETPTVAQTPTPTYQTTVNVPPVQNFGETTVLSVGSGIGETTVLGATTAIVQDMPHLIRMKNNEKINLNKPVFRIGKEKSYVDYFIGDNTAISRSHANFITRDGEYFVTDTNSTNHTYVNGVMIQSNVEKKLAHGDKVRLANEDFEFKLY